MDASSESVYEIPVVKQKIGPKKLNSEELVDEVVADQVEVANYGNFEDTYLYDCYGKRRSIGPGLPE